MQTEFQSITFRHVRELSHRATILSAITHSKKQSTSGDTFTDKHPNVKNTPRAVVRFEIGKSPEFRLIAFFSPFLFVSR